MFEYQSYFVFESGAKTSLYDGYMIMLIFHAAIMLIYRLHTITQQYNNTITIYNIIYIWYISLTGDNTINIFNTYVPRRVFSYF